MATRNENIKLTISAKDKAGKKLSSIQKKIVGIGAAYLGWRAVTGILSDITKAGIEHEKVWTDVTASLVRHNIAVESTIGTIRKFSDEMQTLSGISDEVIGKATQAFIDYGQDAEGAMDTVRVAMDLAAGGSMDLMAAVDLLAKASVGYTGTLSRYGIIIDESIPKAEKFAAAIEQINEKFGGAAQARAGTMAVRISLLSQKYGDLQEELSKFLAPALTGVIDGLIDLLNNLSNTMASVGVRMSIIFGAISEHILSVTRLIELSGGAIQSALAGNFALAAVQAGQSMKQMEDVVGGGMERVKTIILNWAGGAQEWFDLLSNAWGITWDKILDGTKVDAENTQKSIQENLIDPVQAAFNTLAANIERDWKRTQRGLMVESVEVAERTIGAYASVRDEFERAEEAKRQAAYETAQFIGQQVDLWTDAMVASMRGAEVKMERIFKEMARAFVLYFIREATKGTQIFVNSFLKILLMFDKAANDRMAMQQGQHFAQFFKQGAMSEMSGHAFPSMLASTPMPAMAYAGGGGAPSPAGMQVTVNINAPVTTDGIDDWIVHGMAPRLVEAAKMGLTSIALEPFVQTEDSSGVIT